MGLLCIDRSRQVSSLGLGQSLSKGGFLPHVGKVPVCVREEEESREVRLRGRCRHGRQWGIGKEAQA